MPGMMPPPCGMSPPPPPGGLLSSPTHHQLPFGLRAKKEFKPETSMKRLNWSKVSLGEKNRTCEIYRERK